MWWAASEVTLVVHKEVRRCHKSSTLSSVSKKHDTSPLPRVVFVFCVHHFKNMYMYTRYMYMYVYIHPYVHFLSFYALVVVIDDWNFVTCTVTAQRRRRSCDVWLLCLCWCVWRCNTCVRTCTGYYYTLQVLSTMCTTCDVYNIFLLYLLYSCIIVHVFSYWIPYIGISVISVLTYF